MNSLSGTGSRPRPKVSFRELAHIRHTLVPLSRRPVRLVYAHKHAPALDIGCDSGPQPHSRRAARELRGRGGPSEPPAPYPSDNMNGRAWTVR